MDGGLQTDEGALVWRVPGFGVEVSRFKNQVFGSRAGRGWWIGGRRWRSDPSGKGSHERLTRGTVISTMRRAAHPSGSARCGAGAGCSAMNILISI